MADRQEAPYRCHIFVCTNDRKGERKSCADGQTPVIKDALKEEIGRRGWQGSVRISSCGCMGLCARGPNVILYPQKTWFSAASMDDVEQILSAVGAILADARPPSTGSGS
jgi:(2Fe-2S) ferredoxin